MTKRPTEVRGNTDEERTLYLEGIKAGLDHAAAVCRDLAAKTLEGEATNRSAYRNAEARLLNARHHIGCLETHYFVEIEI